MMRGRALARARWQAVAGAEFDRETLLWVANVAAAILRADDIEGDAERRAAVVEAVGLFGRHDAEREIIRALVKGADHTCTMIERGSRWQPARTLARGERTARRREAVADALGLEETPAAVDKRIARAMAN